MAENKWAKWVTGVVSPLSSYTSPLYMELWDSRYNCLKNLLMSHIPAAPLKTYQARLVCACLFASWYWSEYLRRKFGPRGLAFDVNKIIVDIIYQVRSVYGQITAIPKSELIGFRGVFPSKTIIWVTNRRFGRDFLDRKQLRQRSTTPWGF